MPFNGSGTYNLPTGNPVVTGTPISSTTTNSTNSDIATALTNCLTRDGQSSPTAAIPMSNQKITGLAKGTLAGDAMRFEQTAQIDETTGANSNVKSITGLTTPLAVTQGGTGVTTSTGSGANVLSTSPTLVTPILGTPTSGTLTNCTFPTLNQNTTGTAAKATNVAGGTAGKVLYQSGVDTTAFTAAGTAGQFLQSNGTSAPGWASISGTYATLGANTFTDNQTIRFAVVGTGTSGTTFGYSAFLGTSLSAGTLAADTSVVIGDAAKAFTADVVLGSRALYAASAGGQNTLIGYRAGYAQTSSYGNTYIGANAGFNTTTGIANVCIGYNCVTSTTIISNEVNISNGSITARFQGSASAWSFVSDERDKTNIVDLTLGLNFISQLKPRVFEWNLRHTDVDKGKPSSGFIAQEVLAVMQSENAMYTNLVDTNNPEQYSFAASNLIPVLVKAIQELTAKVAALEARIA